MHLDRCSLKPKPPVHKVWDPVYGDESEAEDLAHWGPSSAAEDFAERQLSDSAGEEMSSFEEGKLICVRCPDGSLKKYNVRAEHSVDFCVSEYPEEDADEEPAGA